MTTDGPWPDITHSCIAADSGFADPGVRLRDFVAKFGDNGHVFSVCEANYGPPLNEIAQKIAAAMGLAIVPGADGGIDATTM